MQRKRIQNTLIRVQNVPDPGVAFIKDATYRLQLYWNQNKETNNATHLVCTYPKHFRLDNMSSLSCSRRLTLSLSRGLARAANFSSSPIGCAQVSVETDANGIATLSMNKAPVNSLNTEFIQELTQAVLDTEKTAKVIFWTVNFQEIIQK